jgi:ubiquitin C-terminal hydrolase
VHIAPEVLVIVLKRFLGPNTPKLATPVSYGHTLNLSPCSPQPDVEYSLLGVASHAGRLLNGGHYVATVRVDGDGEHGSGPFYHFNDQVQTPVDPAAALRSDAYLLFYERKKARAGGQSS